MEQNQSMKKWYEIVPNPQNDNDEQQAFRITEGKFQDVIYKYNKFGVNDKPNDDGTLTYKFEYDILEIPEEIVNINDPVDVLQQAKNRRKIANEKYQKLLKMVLRSG